MQLFFSLLQEKSVFGRKYEKGIIVKGKKILFEGNTKRNTYKMKENTLQGDSFCQKKKKRKTVQPNLGRSSESIGNKSSTVY